MLLVPIDVRVVDKDGNPITDLTSADFTVFENGVRQEISQFSTQAYSGDVPPEAPPRTFFVILGRGRLNSVENGIDDLIDCVRTKLHPLDRVAVLAYMHVTDFTTDHDAVVRLLERYRERCETLERMIEGDGRRFAGAPSQPLRAETQLALQDLFFAPGLPHVRLLPGASGGRGTIYSTVVYYRSALDYLRHIAGEKQLVVLIDQPFRVESFRRDAAAARAAVSVIQVGGVSDSPIAKGRVNMTSDPLTDGAILNVREHRDLAEYTGGYAAFYRDAGASLAKLVRATSFQYLLGYYPSRPSVEGESREIRIEINRPGLATLYRHAYEALPLPDPGPPDLRKIYSENRIRRAASLSLYEYQARLAAENRLKGQVPYSSLPMRLSPSVIRPDEGGIQVRVEVTVNANYVTFSSLNGRYTASLDIAAFVRDKAGTAIGEAWDRIELDLDEKALTRVRRERIRHTLTVNVTGDPHEVKVVLYEYSADRTGAATARVK